METSIKVFDACKNGNVEAIQQLISDGLDVNESLFGKSAPLHVAAIAGKRRVVKLLLRSDAVVNAKDSEGLTALHHAAARANVGTARDLVKFKANVNETTTGLITPLAIAARKGFAEVRVPLFIMLGGRYGVRKNNYRNVHHFRVTFLARRVR